MGRKEDAITYFKEGLVIKPSASHARYELALIYAGMGNKRAAMEEYEILKKLEPSLAETLLREIGR